MKWSINRFLVSAINMKISIYDRGPIGAKVDVNVGEQNIAFPEHSFRALIDLFSILHAQGESSNTQRREAHFLIEIIPSDERDRLLKTVQTLTDDNVQLDYLLKSAITEQQRFLTAPLWKRIGFAVRRKLSCGPSSQDFSSEGSLDF